MHILADENMPAVESSLAGRAEVRRMPGRAIHRADLAGVDALWVRSVTRVNRELLEGTRVRFVGSATAGTDHIDLDWLRQSGIAFASAPGANANSVVEYVLCAIAETDDFLERLLAGALVGIVGFGHVGSLLAERLQKLGIAFRAHDPWLAPDAVAHAASLDAIAGCEVICLHPSLTDRAPWPSRHLVDAALLANLHERQLLINASRGEVVDNEALAVRLQEKSAPQTVLDVWEREPNISAQLLSRVRLGTPHIAGYSYDSKIAATRCLVNAMVAENLLPPGQSPADQQSITSAWRLDSASSGADALRQLLRGAYRIVEDDRHLREATLARTPEQAAAAFDALRREYPQRRELAGGRVGLAPKTEQYVGLVAALGCEALIEPREV